MRMAARSRWIVLFLLVAALVALAGCGGSSDTGSDATGAQVKEPAAESPPEPPEAEAGELEGAQRKLEANGYSVIILSEPHDLENVANGTTIVARSGISINGKGVHRAIGYAFNSPAEAGALLKSIPGLASSIRGNRLYFVGEKDPNAPFDRMVRVAEG
jgi:hypothetical protein